MGPAYVLVGGCRYDVIVAMVMVCTYTYRFYHNIHIICVGCVSWTTGVSKGSKNKSRRKRYA